MTRVKHLLFLTIVEKEREKKKKERRAAPEGNAVL